MRVPVADKMRTGLAWLALLPLTAALAACGGGRDEALAEKVGRAEAAARRAEAAQAASERALRAITSQSGQSVAANEALPIAIEEDAPDAEDPYDNTVADPDSSQP